VGPRIKILYAILLLAKITVLMILGFATDETIALMGKMRMRQFVEKNMNTLVNRDYTVIMNVSRLEKFAIESTIAHSILLIK
jgi:hypothetical protein